MNNTKDRRDVNSSLSTIHHNIILDMRLFKMHCVHVFSSVQSIGARFRGTDQFDGLERQRPETGENGPHGVFERR